MSNKLSVQEAREILEDECDGVSDEQINQEIEIAEFFKNIFFDFLKKNKLRKQTVK